MGRNKARKMKNMRVLVVAVIYLMFFLSGAAALIYQVVWVRSLTLIFGGSHLAVTTVLSIFMAGLALGGYAIGRYVDNVKKPLRLYGMLELGIALSAILFVGLMNIYPSIYIPLAQGRDDSPLYLSYHPYPLFHTCADRSDNSDGRHVARAFAVFVPSRAKPEKSPVVSLWIQHARGRPGRDGSRFFPSEAVFNKHDPLYRDRYQRRYRPYQHSPAGQGGGSTSS